MDRLLRFLDQIKAEEALKEKTRAYVMTAQIHSETVCGAQEIIRIDDKKSSRSKVIRAVSSVAACAMIFFGAYAYYKAPVNYISLDINPSVELGINVLNRVVTVEGINEDGQSLIETPLKNLSSEASVEALVRTAARQGYLSEDGTTVISLTVVSDHQEKAMLLQDKIEERTWQTLSKLNLTAIVYTDCSSSQIRTPAREMGLSPGKYKLIAFLQNLDPSIPKESYKDAGITEIIIKAGELLDLSGKTDADSGEFEWTCAKIIAAAQEIRMVPGVGVQSQWINRNPSESDGQPEGMQTQKPTQTGEEKMQTQLRNPLQIQDQNQSIEKGPIQEQQDISQVQDQERFMVQEGMEPVQNQEQDQDSPQEEEAPMQNQQQTQIQDPDQPEEGQSLTKTQRETN
ncbi:MAG TPA: hypothetical protein DIT32_04020 [Peptococcaceae bacterium]|nr:hypothetical protein [Peptococcaceae bacterium]